MQKIEPYPIHYDKSLNEDFSEYEFDENGLPLVRFNRAADWQHNPVTICQYGLHHLNCYLQTGTESSRQIFLSTADWLQNNAEPGPNDTLVWPYRVNIPFYRLQKPWLSGMAQGQALSSLIRAYQLTGDEKYMRTARRSFGIFKIEVKNGGVCFPYPDGSMAIEEYPSTSASYVLNGFMFALFGIHDCYRETESTEARQLFDQFINSLINNLQNYDTGFWSYYDLMPPLRLASRAYHKVHIIQLNRLHELTGETLFRDFAARWQRYEKSSYCRLRWLLAKIKQKLTI